MIVYPSTLKLLNVEPSDLTIPPRMREVSFSHQPKKEEFDYNAAVSFL